MIVVGCILPMPDLVKYLLNQKKKKTLDKVLFHQLYSDKWEHKMIVIKDLERNSE